MVRAGYRTEEPGVVQVPGGVRNRSEELVRRSPTAGVASDTGELVLPLADVAHLFTAPPIDPLAESPTQVLGTSGVSYLLELLRGARKQKPPRTLVIQRPAGGAPLVDAEQFARSLRRFAEWRIESERRELRNIYRHGWRVMGIAMVLLALCLAISSVFASDLTKSVPLIRKTLEYGFEIIGWVILWHPVDVLVFAPMSIRSRIRALQMLASLDVVVRSDPACP